MDFSLPLLPTDSSDTEELYPSLPFPTEDVTQPLTPTIPLTPPVTDEAYVTVTDYTCSPFLPPLAIPRREISFQGESIIEREHRIHHGIDLLKAQCFRGNGSGERYRNWCYTLILNDTEFHKAYEPIIDEDFNQSTIPFIKKLQCEVFFDIRTPITYHVWEIEHGSTTGTRHIQGYVEFDKKMIMNTVKKIFCCSWMHLEARRGTAQQAADYCKKEHIYEEHGTLSQQRHIDAGRFGHLGAQHGYLGAEAGREAERARWEAIRSDIMALPFDKWAEKYPDIAIKHPNSYKRIKFDSLAVQPKATLDGDLHDANIWIWGKAGCGKTSRVYTEFPGAFRKPKNKWWDGYQFEEVVVLDDVVVKDGDWMNGFLRQWADRYGFVAEIKGASAHIRPKRFIVTSNFSIDEVFATATEADREAIHRRFKEEHMGPLDVPDPVFYPLFN